MMGRIKVRGSGDIDACSSLQGEVSINVTATAL